MESCRKGTSDRSVPGAEALQTPVSDNSAVTVATSKLLILAQGNWDECLEASRTWRTLSY